MSCLTYTFKKYPTAKTSPIHEPQRNLFESAGNISGIGMQKSLFDCLLAGIPGSFEAKIYSSDVENYPLAGSLIVMLL